MTISSALPIQFWDIESETFQEQTRCGKTDVCYCEYIRTGEQVLQIYNPGNEPTLKAFDSEAAEIDIDASTSGAVSGMYTITFTIPDSAIGKTIQFIVYQTGGTVEKMKSGCVEVLGEYSLQLPSALPGQWDQEGALAVWTANVGNAEVTIPIPGGQSNTLYKEFSAGAGAYSVVYSVSITGTGTNSLTFNFYSGATPVYSRDFFATDVLFIEQKTFSVPITRIEVIAFASDGDSDFVVSSIAMIAAIGNLSNESCIKTIRYSNHKNFRDMNGNVIDYESGSPTPSFEIHIPAMFFDENFPLEEEVHPQSDDTWKRVWSRMEAKKLFEIGRLPYYMHKKLQMILVHDIVEIDDEFWVKRDAYNIEAGNKRFPLKTGSVLLTNRDEITRNLI